MILNYNIYALLETVGFIQTITLGCLLILLNVGKYRSTILLGIFLILFGLETIPLILDSLDVFTYYPELYLLPFDFYWLYFPIFYIYVHQTSLLSNEKTKYWMLYPGILVFLVQIAIFFQPYATKVSIAESTGYSIYFYVKLAYGISIGLYILHILYRHRIEVRNYFSLVQSKELTWARTFLLYTIFGSVLYAFFSRVISENLFAKLFFTFFDVVIIFWVSYHGVKQRNILSLISEKEDFDDACPNAGLKGQSDSALTEGLKVTMSLIDTYMQESEPFVNTDLNIVNLAKEIDVHPKRISKAINVIRHQNFNTYVNQYRIRKVEKILENSSYENLSIEGIGNEVGFHSKSTFYGAFKKFTGTTPSNYKKQNKN